MIRTGAPDASRLVVVAATCAALCFTAIGCSGTSDGRGAAQQGPWLPPREDRDGQVSIRSSTVAELDAWVGQETTVIADVIEIEATRVPFASNVSIQSSAEMDSAGRRLIERTDAVDPATGVPTVTVVNRSGVKTNPKLLPQMRMGGRQFIATDRLVVRWIPAPGTDHPVSLTAVARGRVSLLESSPARKVKGTQIVLRADVARPAASPGGGAPEYEFRSAEDRQP